MAFFTGWVGRQPDLDAGGGIRHPTSTRVAASRLWIVSGHPATGRREAAGGSGIEWQLWGFSTITSFQERI